MRIWMFLVVFWGGLFALVASNESRAKKEVALQEAYVVNHYRVAFRTTSNQLGVVMVNASGVTVVPRSDINGTKIAVTEWMDGFHAAKRVVVYVGKDDSGKTKADWERFIAQLRVCEEDWRSRTYPRNILPPDNIFSCDEPKS